jgi:hypothetical protein
MLSKQRGSTRTFFGGGGLEFKMKCDNSDPMFRFDSQPYWRYFANFFSAKYFVSGVFF